MAVIRNPQSAIRNPQVRSPQSARRDDILEAVLGTVERPGRYCGGERNAVKKDLSKVALKVALAFPDTYEIGMSHVGLKVLYDILNSRERTAAERVFMPWKDFASTLRGQRIPLFSLENRLPLSEFDVVGFSLQHELCYTNVLEMLDLSGIPIRACDRGDDMPLIIGGGPCAFNPEPMCEFFDFFVVGDGEQIVAELASVMEDNKAKGWNRKEVVSRVSKLRGIYVPTDYQFEYSEGYVSKIIHKDKVYDDPFAAPKIERAFIPELERAPCPERLVVPNISIVHDRAAVEIMRGCPRGCRFCQAGYISRPLRERSLATVVALAESAIANTGFDELSFLSLSSGDYSGIEQLIGRCASGFAGGKVAVSLPSLRVETMTQPIVDGIRSIKKTGFTLAPEAATDRLRRVINKPTSNEMVLESAGRAFSAGWKRVKLYFMVGLPGETEEDIDAIGELVKQLSNLARREGGGGRKVVVSISTFIPKPHTALQWASQAPADDVISKLSRMRDSMNCRNVELKWHNAKMSVLEGVLCRGDRRLSSVIERAWRMGCVLDNWTEEFDFRKWMAAFEDCGIVCQDYLAARDPQRFLPWEHIGSGVSREFLLQERAAAIAEKLTPDCISQGECQSCGACPEPASYLEAMRTRRNAAGRPDLQVRQVGQVRRVGQVGQVGQPRQMVFPLRCKYERFGPARFISHLDVLTALARAARQSGLPIEYTKGFNPQPRISAGLALPIGHASLAEYVDINVSRPCSTDKLIESMNDCLMRGIRFVAASHLFKKSLSLCALVSEIDYSVLIDLARLSEVAGAESRFNLNDAASHLGRIEWILAQESIVVKRTTPKRTAKLDVRAFIGALSLTGVESGKALLRMTLKLDRDGRTAPPSMVLSELYGTERHVLYFADIIRLEQFCWRRGARRSLLEVGAETAVERERPEEVRKEP
ncbi:MAG: TIGR03960 family B12-binding radical SAM protein [Candidatus Coatesbacteria bacterium]|nr:TIGR03960 family B12-binding radical SAM protein [Candidatus Coatesbacteria bacterium]